MGRNAHLPQEGLLVPLVGHQQRLNKLYDRWHVEHAPQHRAEQLGGEDLPGGEARVEQHGLPRPGQLFRVVALGDGVGEDLRDASADGSPWVADGPDPQRIPRAFPLLVRPAVLGALPDGLLQVVGLAETRVVRLGQVAHGAALMQLVDREDLLRGGAAPALQLLRAENRLVVPEEVLAKAPLLRALPGHDDHGPRFEDARLHEHLRGEARADRDCHALPVEVLQEDGVRRGGRQDYHGPAERLIRSHEAVHNRLDLLPGLTVADDDYDQLLLLALPAAPQVLHRRDGRAPPQAGTGALLEGARRPAGGRPAALRGLARRLPLL
mmetsp:Transcript_8153/g.21743  ORF Transcript_8153/g.21743 Transcript_8153/m.21743 type:complete len:324 (+) Transcript_8153:130-1101(+)